MFWFVVDVILLRRLGLGRPIRYVLLVFFLGSLIAGLIYACVIFDALKERSYSPDVHTNSAH
jgi:hypothetical protein